MSFHREHVIWPSLNGTFAIGFYHYDDAPRRSWEDFDPEWDVEYDFSRFNWASSGHASVDSARYAWRGANPGGGDLILVREGWVAECEDLDAMLAAYVSVSNLASRRRPA